MWRHVPGWGEGQLLADGHPSPGAPPPRQTEARYHDTWLKYVMIVRS